jgi:hypothetical protein
MRLRNILAVLAVLVCFFGCRSEEDETIPDALVGVWKTSTPGYEDNSLELKKDEIVFGEGHSEFSVDSIYKVETVRPPGENTVLITIHYTDEYGKDSATSIYYDATPPGSIRFKNQTQIEWRLFQRKPVERGPLSPRRPESSWGGLSDGSITVALFGVALTAGAMLWRWQKSTAEKAVAAVENVEVLSAPEITADREPSRTGSAEGRTDWTQAPTTVPVADAKGQRRSERVLLKIPLYVSGIDVHGKSFGEHTFTLSINRHGAFIWLRHSCREGDQVTLTNVGTGGSCTFRLCDRTKAPFGEGTAWGIECLEPATNFWRIRFPERAPEPSPQENITALIACTACHSREVADLSVAEYRTMLERGLMERACPDCGAVAKWEFILVEATATAGPEEVSTVSLPSGEEKRREKRIIARLPIRLRHPESGRVERTVTENVSRSGVCCAANMELKADDGILLTFLSGVGPSEEENPAQVRWCRSMGENRKTLYGMRLQHKNLVGQGPERP